MAAYAIIFIFLVLCGVGLYAITFNEPVDELITQMNVFISNGEVSTEFVGYWEFAIGLLIALPILCLIALSIWSYVRAIERRQEV